MPSVDNLEFLNLNTLRSYPLKEGVSRLSMDGIFTIPDNFLADITLAASSDVTRRFYISKINNFIDTIQLEISDDLTVLVGTVLITKATHTLYTSYTLSSGALYAGATGKIVIAVLDGMSSMPAGTFLFGLSATELEARCAIPSLAGINRITFTDSSGAQLSLTGNVAIEVRDNLRFTYDSMNNRIILDAGEGLGLNTVCDSSTEPIRTINGIAPDDDGNFTLDFASCASLTVLPSGEGLLLNDVCCKPCIGCDEIGTLTDRLITLETDLLTLRQFYTDLLRTFNDFKTTVTFTCSC